jgi:AraC-like DNA-binding protein
MDALSDVPRAVRLTGGGTDSIAAIANRVGYDSEAAFSRAFKKSVGAPPSQWRRSRKEGSHA